MTTTHHNAARRPQPLRAEPDPVKLDRKLLTIACAVVLGVIMVVLDMTVVNVAIPTFQRTFAASYASVAWAVTAYTLALAALIPLTGWAADRFGTKRLYLTAIGLFVAGSVLCATAWSLPVLIIFRVLQGLGGGMLMPLSMTILTRAAGPQRIGRMMALLGVPMMLGPICGPILGGYLIGSLSWHWIFLINAPIGAVALTACALALPADKSAPGERFDFVGMLLLSPGLALFLFGISSIPAENTIAATRVLLPAATGIILMAAFMMHALGRRNALMDLSLFKDKDLTLSVVTLVLFVIAFMGAMMLLPSYFMQVRREDALMAGLLVAPQGIGAMLSMPIAGRLVDRIGPRFVVLPGIVTIVIGLGIFSRLGIDASYWYTSASLLIAGLGMGCTMMPLMTSALATLTDAQIARGSTLMNIARQMGASIGAAVISVILTTQMTRHGIGASAMEKHPTPAVSTMTQHQIAALQHHTHAVLTGMGDAFSTTFTVSIAIIAVTAVPVLFLPHRKADPKRAPRPAAPNNPTATETTTARTPRD